MQQIHICYVYTVRTLRQVQNTKGQSQHVDPTSSKLMQNVALAEHNVGDCWTMMDNVALSRFFKIFMQHRA